MYGSRGCTGHPGALCQQNCILAGTGRIQFWQSRHLARDRFEELHELSVLVFYFYNPEESQLELGGAAWAAMEAHMRDLSTALGFSSHVGVTTWSQRNFGTLYMVTSPAYQALL